MPLFTFRKMSGEALPVTMSGVRMGERVLQIGVNDPWLAGAIAAKVGLSGHAAIAVQGETAAAQARAGAEDAGGLVEVHDTRLDALPFPEHAFDLAVINSVDGLLANHPTRAGLLREAFRVLRRGGRVVVIEAGPRTGIGAWLRPGPKTDGPYETAGGAVTALQVAGFKPVRLLAEREGYRFTEGLKTQ